MEFYPLEDGGVKEEVWFPLVDAIINAHRLVLRAGANGNVSIALRPEHSSHVSSFALLMLGYILIRGELRGLSKEVLRGPRVEGPVIYLGRRV